MKTVAEKKTQNPPQIRDLTHEYSLTHAASSLYMNCSKFKNASENFHVTIRMESPPTSLESS